MASEHDDDPDRLLRSEDIEKLEEVGDGVTSVVFRGIYKGAEVAVKELNYNPASMPEKARVNLERELLILRKVKHPHLVKFVGVAEDGDRIKIVTEFCWGGTAFDLLHNTDLRLSWEQKQKMVTDVALAMEYLHDQRPPIIHRDLKSLNLLLQEAVQTVEDVPIVKVTDFGLSRMQDSAGHCMTKDAGTCHWMAPEVFTGNAYTKKVDVYSYSMIMFEVICQDIPFGDVPAKKLGLLVTKGERPDISLVPADCPDFLRRLMIQGWAQDAEQRLEFAQIVQVIHLSSC